MTNQPFPGPPESVGIESFSSITAYVRTLRNVVFNMWRGKLQCVGTITLTANSATTVLARKGLSPFSVVSFDPKTANAAAEKAAGTMYVLTANRGNDSWTITNANNAQADRTFQYSVIG